MDFTALIDLLKDNNPAVRIQALRTLAMLEETRAIEHIKWIFHNDPSAEVRDVAQWAGSIVWKAQERGYSTERALREQLGKQNVALHEQALTDSLYADVSGMSTHKKVAALHGSNVERNRTEWERQQLLDAARQRQQNNVAKDDLDLLDAGLTNLEI